MAHAVTVQSAPRFINHMSGASLRAYPVGDKMVTSLDEQIPDRGDLLEDRLTGQWYGVTESVTLFRKWNDKKKPKCQIMVTPISPPRFLPQSVPRNVAENPNHYQLPNNWATSEEIDVFLH